MFDFLSRIGDFRFDTSYHLFLISKPPIDNLLTPLCIPTDNQRFLLINNRLLFVEL